MQRLGSIALLTALGAVKAGLLLTLLALILLPAGAQEELAPSTQDGPLTIRPVTPTPDKDGYYRLGPGITAPTMVRHAEAIYPPESAETDRPHICILSMVIGVDGIPTHIQVYSSPDSPFNESAIEAVKQSEFQPGTLDGKPVPVLVYVRVPFTRISPPIPMLLRRYPQVGGFSQSSGGSGWSSGPLPPRPWDKPPVVLYAPEAEFSKQARAEKFQGVVLVSVLVTEEGLPTDVRVVRPVGKGLDEKAVEAVSQYRFQPATKDGAPIAAHITVEVNFRFY